MVAIPAGVRTVVGIVLLILGILVAVSVLPLGAVVVGILFALCGVGLML